MRFLDCQSLDSDPSKRFLEFQYLDSGTIANTTIFKHLILSVALVVIQLHQLLLH